VTSRLRYAAISFQESKRSSGAAPAGRGGPDGGSDGGSAIALSSNVKEREI
jgi:hypothetical protein